MLSRNRSVLSSILIFVGGVAVGTLAHAGFTVNAQSKERVFELRTYTAPEGKLEELHARFRNHTMRIFQKHGMTNVGYWRPLDAPMSQNALVYLLAYPDREAAKKSWDAFRNDPEWQKVNTESQVNGKIVAKVDSVFLSPTDYSPMK